MPSPFLRLPPAGHHWLLFNGKEIRGRLRLYFILVGASAVRGHLDVLGVLFGAAQCLAVTSNNWRKPLTKLGRIADDANQVPKEAIG